MQHFTDIHCHVLPGVDDGARDHAVSIKMLLRMYDEGIRNVILTPHYHGGHMQPSADVIKTVFGQLKEAVALDPELKQMNLYLGCEIYYYPSVVEWLDQGRVLTMADSDYVLLEFGYTMDKRIIFEGVNAVVSAGYRPILAHVERYKGLTGDLAGVDDLIERGAYIQINSEALYDRHRIKSFVAKLLKREMVHFMATDAHDNDRRAPYMAKEAAHIAKRYGEDYCRRLLVENPAKVIENIYI